MIERVNFVTDLDSQCERAKIIICNTDMLFKWTSTKITLLRSYESFENNMFKKTTFTSPYESSHT